MNLTSIPHSARAGHQPTHLLSVAWTIGNLGECFAATATNFRSDQSNLLSPSRSGNSSYPLDSCGVIVTHEQWPGADLVFSTHSKNLRPRPGCRLVDRLVRYSLIISHPESRATQPSALISNSSFWQRSIQGRDAPGPPSAVINTLVSITTR